MAKLKLFGIMSNLQILLHTLLAGKSVGADDFGNRYYRGKPRGYDKRERRWVIYPGAPEASNVPAEWHGWLHHQTDVVPTSHSPYRKNWQKPHLPNQTGSDRAYLPPGARGGVRPHATGDYVAWEPPQS